MKGMIFTEFLSMVESRFGLDVVDRMIEESRVPREGAYASTGTYPHEELVAMVGALSRIVGVPATDLVHAYGRHLFDKLASTFPRYVSHASSAFEFLASIDGYIHVEVRKIYPDAELPRFTHHVSDDGRTMTLEYRSPRRFDALAHGLLEGALAHFGEPTTVSRQELPGGDGSLFVIRKTAR